MCIQKSVVYSVTRWATHVITTWPNYHLRIFLAPQKLTYVPFYPLYKGPTSCLLAPEICFALLYRQVIEWYSLVSDCFPSATSLWDAAILVGVAEVHSFCFVAGIPLRGYPTISASMFLLMDTQVVPNFVNEIPLNILEFFFWCPHIKPVVGPLTDIFLKWLY